MAFLRKSYSHIRSRQQVRGLESTTRALQDWFETPAGQQLLMQEQQLLDEELSYLFGYHLAQLSISRNVKLYENSRICHCFSIGSGTPDTAADVGMYSDFDALPLEDEQVDVTVLHHVLEFSSNPHQVLKEASRVTIARGHIIVIGFNPYSAMGMCKPFAQIFTNKAVWRRNSLAKSRVSDWLQFLDCNTLRIHNGSYGFSWQSRGGKGGAVGRLLRRWQAPFGNFYCLVARKDRASLTPITPSWEKPHRLPAVGKRALSARSAARLSLVRRSSIAPNPRLPDSSNS